MCAHAFNRQNKTLYFSFVLFIKICSSNQPGTHCQVAQENPAFALMKLELQESAMLTQQLCGFLGIQTPVSCSVKHLTAESYLQLLFKMS